MMTFKTYDILSALIPGFLTLLALQIFFGKDFNKDLVVAYTAIAFLLGYLMNTISSWLEGFYEFTWGGKPSVCLLKGKNCWKVPFHEVSEVNKRLKLNCTSPNAKEGHLFAIAMRQANGQKDCRAGDFHSIYVFSRVLLTTTLIGTVILLIENYKDWRYYAMLLPVVFVIWLRCKQQSYYYAREVLNEYLKMTDAK